VPAVRRTAGERTVALGPRAISIGRGDIERFYARRLRDGSGVMSVTADNVAPWSYGFLSSDGCVLRPTPSPTS
jgi:hypothetical protein